ncbi:MAG: hypothetical protein JWM74_512 [Myxococcaceae bacterium]|nr:hypothetical protein [Myxococcaceae bacterium]
MRRALRWTAGAALLVSISVALACTSTLITPTHDAAPPALGDRATEQGSHQCPSPPRILIGVKPAGGSCANAGDCAPTCCACDGGVVKWLAAACERSTQACADSVATCVTTASASLCE